MFLDPAPPLILILCALHVLRCPHREGAITTSDDLLTLVPLEGRVPMAAQPYSGKSPKGWRAPEGTTLFVGNLAFSVDNMRYSTLE